jgi:hypothetical protein
MLLLAVKLMLIIKIAITYFCSMYAADIVSVFNLQISYFIDEFIVFF